MIPILLTKEAMRFVSNTFIFSGSGNSSFNIVKSGNFIFVVYIIRYGFFTLYLFRLLQIIVVVAVFEYHK